MAVLNDIHGPMVFDARTNPKFAGVGPVTAYVTVQGDRWIATFQQAFRAEPRLTERERTAFDLYTAALASSGDANFVLCFAAFELLLDDIPRPAPVLALVDRFIALAKECDLSGQLGTACAEKERDRLLGSLRHLRSRSIRNAGQVLLDEKLRGRTYAGLLPTEFFDKCYGIRNRLVHGSEDFPSRDEVIGVASAFSQLVGDLLAGSLLEFDPASHAVRPERIVAHNRPEQANG
ncbi:MAG: hypothetical protein IT430_20530 [Phycisphaerales bacterium]|nr:hypothetical protein [Phycisphaerales bacterium]